MTTTAVWLILAAGSLLAVGCGAAGAQRGVSLTIAPHMTLADQPVHIVVRGLRPSESVRISLRSTDARGTTWAGVATFRANAAGVADLDHARALSGSYRDVSGTGLVWSMRPTAGAADSAYFWHDDVPSTWNATATAGGETVARSSFERRLTPQPLHKQTLQLSSDGFVGEYVAPMHAVGAHPAVLLVGGSEGGLASTLTAALLAGHGYPALSIAYFGAPSLPTSLSRIPLEYFARALRWLSQRPNVDPRRVLVMGVSRGSEAALLLGAYYPQRVHGVVALVPSSVALCSYPGCAEPAWTLHGQPLPYTRQFDDPYPTDNPHAVIPVQRIRGAVFLDCGTADQTWTSCSYAKAINARLDAYHFAYRHVLYSYRGAGHGIGTLIPYEPVADDTTPSYATEQEQRPHAWRRLLSFLAATEGKRGT